MTESYPMGVNKAVTTIHADTGSSVAGGYQADARCYADVCFRVREGDRLEDLGLEVEMDGIVCNRPGFHIRMDSH